MKTVVLLSGGLDSVTNLVYSASNDRPILALTVDYGQRAVKGEVQAARRFSEWLGIPHQVVDAGWLGRLGGSSLTEAGTVIPALTRDELDNIAVTEKSADAVWVPNRNGVLISIAAAYAERLQADAVVVGFNREEAVTFPDNSEGFLNAMNSALQFSTRGRIAVACHTLNWNKREMVEWLRARTPDFPFEWLWSCYAGGDMPCGQCESCKRQERALA
jgi:7-cyano-7-deazaguanine synthase